MKDKLNRFMQGRYGVDNLARFTLGVALFVIVVGSFLRQNAVGGILDTVGFILIIYTYFRILSRNISARYAENQKPFERQIWDFRKREKVAKNAHVEVFADGTVLLFDYADRDPLTNNANVTDVTKDVFENRNRD